MQEALQLVEAYERASFSGLPEVELHINMDKTKKTLGMVTEHLQTNGELRSLASNFIEVLKVEQEDIFEEVERYRIEACNHYERFDFLGQIGVTSDNKEGSIKFPKATKNTLKFWLHSNQDNPYPTEAEKDYLCTLTKLTRTQLNQWFINGRRRILHTTHIKREYMKVKEEEEDIARAPTKKRTTTKMKYEPVEVKPEQSPPAGVVAPPPLLPIHYSLRPRNAIPKTERPDEIYETAKLEKIASTKTNNNNNNNNNNKTKERKRVGYKKRGKSRR